MPKKDSFKAGYTGKILNKTMNAGKLCADSLAIFLTSLHHWSLSARSPLRTTREKQTESNSPYVACAFEGLNEQIGASVSPVSSFVPLDHLSGLRFPNQYPTQ